MKLNELKKYAGIFNLQTLLVLALSMLSCYLSLHFGLRLYADFLIIGIIIVFPLTFTMREAYRRRERSLQYLSLLKAALQSVLYLFEITKIEPQKKAELKAICNNIMDRLIKYLTSRAYEASDVLEASVQLGAYIKQHKKEVKSNSFKIFSFVLRVNESLEFLLSVRRHHTPWGPKVIVLFAIYSFAIFYPATVMFDGQTNLQVWNVFLMTAFKILILISLYNVQELMEDPFDQNTPDGIRLNDFRLDVENSSSDSVNGMPDSTIRNSISHDKTFYN